MKICEKPYYYGVISFSCNFKRMYLKLQAIYKQIYFSLTIHLAEAVYNLKDRRPILFDKSCC